MFSSHLNFADLLDEVVSRGSAFEPEALTADTLTQLSNETARLALKEQNGDDPWYAYQDANFREAPSDCQAIANLGHNIGWKIRLARGKLRVLKEWQPNDITVQRYRNNDDGIAGHQDYSRDKLLIASFTACGYGPFEILDKRRDGKVVRTFETGPGSLVLMWAPGLGGLGDRRPVHRALQPIVTPRVSITYRMSDLI